MLSKQEETLCRLSVAICQGDWPRLRALREAASGAPDRAWRECVLQAHLFIGFPRVVEALEVLSQVGGLGQPDADELDGPPSEHRRELGRGLFDRIYGSRAEGVRGELECRHPVFAAWIEDHAYGCVLTRPGLSADRRELLAVVCLAATGQERQLASHVRGALRCGATPEELRAALEAVAEQVDEAELHHAERVLERFAPLAS